MVGKENVKEIKDAESLAEMMGAELKGLLETIIKESGKESPREFQRTPKTDYIPGPGIFHVRLRKLCMIFVLKSS